MKTILHTASSRGHANHGWLDTHHTFSFANYYDPSRIHFGMLRVLNDDIVAPGMGFGTHPHDNMEIVSIPLEGDLEHRDSMGNVSVIKHGEIQVMSAGTGITHSEYNKNSDRAVKFLQIWLFPNQEEVTPRYDQIVLDMPRTHNDFLQILSPNKDDDGVWIYQDAWMHLSSLDKGVSKEYHLKKEGNGVYIFVLKGEVDVEGTKLGARDGMGVWETDKVNISALDNAEVLLIEVPMR